jgi:hypothetical protein
VHHFKIVLKTENHALGATECLTQGVRLLTWCGNSIVFYDVFEYSSLWMCFANRSAVQRAIHFARNSDARHAVSHPTHLLSSFAAALRRGTACVQMRDLWKLLQHNSLTWILKLYRVMHAVAKYIEIFSLLFTDVECQSRSTFFSSVRRRRQVHATNASPLEPRRVVLGIRSVDFHTVDGHGRLPGWWRHASRGGRRKTPTWIRCRLAANLVLLGESMCSQAPAVVVVEKHSIHGVVQDCQERPPRDLAAGVSKRAHISSSIPPAITAVANVALLRRPNQASIGQRQGGGGGWRVTRLHQVVDLTMLHPFGKSQPSFERKLKTMSQRRRMVAPQSNDGSSCRMHGCECRVPIAWPVRVHLPRSPPLASSFYSSFACVHGRRENAYLSRAQPVCRD